MGQEQIEEYGKWNVSISMHMNDLQIMFSVVKQLEKRFEVIKKGIEIQTDDLLFLKRSLQRIEFHIKMLAENSSRAKNNILLCRLDNFCEVKKGFLEFLYAVESAKRKHFTEEVYAHIKPSIDRVLTWMELAEENAKVNNHKLK